MCACTPYCPYTAKYSRTEAKLPHVCRLCKSVHSVILTTGPQLEHVHIHTWFGSLNSKKQGGKLTFFAGRSLVGCMRINCDNGTSSSPADAFLPLVTANVAVAANVGGSYANPAMPATLPTLPAASTFAWSTICGPSACMGSVSCSLPASPLPTDWMRLP